MIVHHTRAEPSRILPMCVRDVTFVSRDQTLLQGISLDLNAGALTVLMGPNGAGKSLALRIFHGLLAPSSGSVDWARPFPDARKQQAFVFQRPVMLRRSTIANVEFALACRGIPRRARRGRAAKALDRVGLGVLAHRHARVLSVGEQQRLALARAWAIEPEVLFLDEPTASLDPAATQAIENIIRSIHASGTKVVLTTHDLGQAKRLADEIIFLNRGRLVEHGPAREFFAGPDSEEARAFLDGRLSW